MTTRTTFLLLSTLSIFSLTAAHEACLDLTGLITDTNTFCAEYSGKTCCSTQEDQKIQNLFRGLTINNPTCSSFIKQALCSRCDPWGAHLFGVEEQNARTFPVLCDGYCTNFYTACAGVNINWPNGQNPIENGTPVLRDAYPTRDDFCNNYAPISDEVACYNGTVFAPRPAPPVPAGSSEICVEFFTGSDGGLYKLLKLADPHDKSGRLFAAYQDGTVKVLNQTTGAVISTLLHVNALDNGEAGLIGIAAHPNFTENGKLYIYWSSNSIPSTCLDDDWCNGGTCKNGTCGGLFYMTNILDEYFVPKGASIAQTPAIRRLMTVAKPYNNHNGGDLTFGPDGYLYFGTGDGGDANDPVNNAQNINRRLGKIFRIDVDATPIAGRQYAVPASNPFLDSKFPEIYALGFRNPWRMSFSPFNPAYLIVADVGQDFVEEIDLVVRGGNYGWPKLEGTGITRTKNGAWNINITTGSLHDPVVQYFHNQTGSQGPSVIGGYFYAGSRDKCLYGAYLFGDWTNILWSATESAPGTGRFSYNVNARYNARCTGANCNGFNSIASFSVDDNQELYILGTAGAYRLVEPSRCGITCNANPQTSQTYSTILPGQTGLLDIPDVTGTSTSQQTPSGSSALPNQGGENQPAASGERSQDSSASSNLICTAAVTVAVALAIVW